MMDIIDFLIEDHNRMRLELSKIHKQLNDPNLRQIVKTFITDFETHESAEEDILFPALRRYQKEELGPLALSYDLDHEKIWELLDELMSTVDYGSLDHIQRVYFAFDSLAESHFRYEERTLFPIIRKIMDKKSLHSLGAMAEKHFKQRSHPIFALEGVGTL
ncbi:MAG: hypothetical protein A2901_03550 [Elusimicrobia bacterium RIFCSPLOWO2_01_FULL_54_10]|nr:MAG: hypothetical protein A2901_03550 [Elusimicrobia bacterium RIFCSPLOWO2_01_FULL_54_10]